MKNRIMLIIIVILGIGVYISSTKEKTAFFNEEENIELTIKDSSKDQEYTIDLEEYIIGVVAGEMPASFEEEALKAQAIAARTYAIYKMNTASKSYDLLTDVSNQVYIDKKKMEEKWQEDYLKYYKKIESAVNKTKDLVMKYDGKVISSYYFAISNGKTEDVSLVFGEKKNYLKSVESSWDRGVKNFSKEIEMSKEDFCWKLNIECKEIIISDINRSETGRINTIKINNQEYKGTEIRKLLNLRSTDFKIEINDNILITTKGYGHGVGMSQYGANEMAKLGYTYDEILKYYYQGIYIEKINV